MGTTVVVPLSPDPAKESLSPFHRSDRSLCATPQCGVPQPAPKSESLDEALRRLFDLLCVAPDRVTAPSSLLCERGGPGLRALEALLHQRVRCPPTPLPVTKNPLLPWAWFPSRTSPVPRWWTLRRAGRSRYLKPGADGEPSTPSKGGVCPRRKAARRRSACGPLGVFDVQRAGPTGWTSQHFVGHTVPGVA